jgi:serine/threonine-protein kinase
VQVTIPSVLSLPIDQAASQLEADGFKVATTFVESSQPANTVIQQSPIAGQSAGKGSVVTLTVSKGPTTSTVPDVTSLDIGSATSTLASSNFKWKIVYEDVTDPSLDGTVLSESPDANTEAKPGTVVTLTVGRASGQTTTTTDTTTTP